MENDPRWRVAHLPLLITVITGVTFVAAGVGYFVAGGPGALGAAAGVTLVTVSFTVTTLAVAWADAVSTPLVLPIGMATYMLKYTLFGIIFYFIATSDWAGRVPMTVGIVVGCVAWTTAQVWWIYRVWMPKQTAFGPRKGVSSDSTGR